MGNEQSNLSGLELDEKALEVTDFWVHHSATLNSGNSISVFIGEPLVSGSLWISQTPLEKLAKNLMVYRHPCILKYISSWHKGSKFYLAVEDVKPLSLVLPSQNTLQICVGLYSILTAVCFLHEKARVSHNNVCVASIYVTKDGNWRLGGMEYLCRYVDLSEDYLCKTRPHRYDKSIDVNESKTSKNISERPYVIDCYAFGVLVNEILQKRNDDEISALISFRNFCKTELQHSDISLRPKLITLLEHPFFSHDFITIHSFLNELPLKSNESKVSFFSGLADKLKTFSEVVVASQLGGLLLSRMVLLDKTAPQNLIPLLLCPRQGPDEMGNGLFSTDNFKQYIVPRLLQIFCVRDAQIRFLLLEHFTHYMNCFTVDELQSQILPELLVGIKDTNDNLVAVTLRALADMVPILGAATVIGGRRAKLFNDGRPIVHSHASKRSRRNSRKNNDALQNATSTFPVIPEINSVNPSTVELNHDLELPERPSPDGEEGETSTEDVEQSAEDDLDNWEDWDINENTTTTIENTVASTNSLTNNEESSGNFSSNLNSSLEPSDLESNVSNLNLTNRDATSDARLTESSQTLQILQPGTLKISTYQKKKILPDISELDIKSQIGAGIKHDDYDFFQDMEPVIETSTKYLLTDTDSNNIAETSNEQVQSKRLDLSVIESDKHVEGWGDELDWE